MKHHKSLLTLHSLAKQYMIGIKQIVAIMYNALLSLRK